MNRFIRPVYALYRSACTDKDSCITDLKKSYTSPGHPIAFSGVQSIKKYYPLLSLSDIENVLSEIESYTLQREYHRSQRNPSYSHFKRYQWQIDLIDIQQLSEQNDNYRYLLAAIDTFTRFAYVRPVLDKTSKSVLGAFKSMLADAGSNPYTLVMDRGLEFRNSDFMQFCRENGIKLYTPDSSIHAAYIERFNRTIQDLLYSYMTENETKRYIDVLPNLVSTYNNRKHRMIGTSPQDAETNDVIHPEIRRKMSAYHETIKPKKEKFQVGDIVRIVKLKGKFNRGYNERSARELFKIHEISHKFKIPMYVLTNYNGNEIISGKFYQNELTKVSGDVFRVEKVLKKRRYKGKNQLFVKWKGFDDTHNSWIDSDDVTQVFSQ